MNPHQALLRSSTAAIALLVASSPAVTAGVNRWTSVGPRSDGVVNALARGPSAADTVYAGTSGGGVFKSEDGGETWNPARFGLANRSVTALAIDPTAAGTVYAATDAGVFRTASGGATWIRISEPIATEFFTSLAIDPAQPSRLYAGTASGVVYGTADGGKTWASLFVVPPFTLGYQAGVGMLAVDIASTVYLTTHMGALYRSRDAGKTWVRTNFVSVQDAYYIYPLVAVDPTSRTAYFVLDRTLYKTTDGGDTWRASGPNISIGGITAIAVSASDPKTIVLGTISGGTAGKVYLSRDAATSWTSLEDLGGGVLRALLVGGEPSPTILAAHDDVLLEHAAGDLQWRPVTQGLDAASVRAVAVSPLDGSKLFAFDGFVPFRSSDGGKNWSSVDSGGATSFFNFTFSPVSPSTALAGTNRGIFRTDDFGASWQRPQPDVFTAAFGFSFDPTAPETVYAATDLGVQKSTDGGRRWSLTGSPHDTSYAVLVDRLNPSNVYSTHLPAAFYYGPIAVTVEKSADGGATWADADKGFDPLRNVTALAMDPIDTKTLYAAVAGKGVYKTADGAASWKWVSADLLSASVSTILIDPANPSILYAATDRGIFRSRDAATSWSAFNSGLTNLAVTSLAVDAAGLLYAGTAGAGVFRYESLSGPLDVSVARNGDTRFSSFDTGTGLAALGRMDPSGRVSRSPPFGPFEGWTPRALADGPDGVTRVLWTHDDGSAALWLVGSTGVTSYRYPSLSGLDAVDVAAGGSSETHVLWAGVDGVVLLRTIDGSGAVARDLFLGPYPGWTAVGIADGADGRTRLLWQKRDGSAGLSLISADGIQSTRRYGGAPGWTALDVAVGGDGLTRILWTHEDGRVAVGVVNAIGEVAYGAARPAPEGLTARRIAAAPDGSSRILLTGQTPALWIVSPDGALLGTIHLN